MIDKLEFLIALASEEHFGRAAEICRVTQSTFSAGIKQLEAALGVMLVQRGSRYVGLTSEGRRALEWALRIVSDARALRSDIKTMRVGLSGQLRIAAIPMALPMISTITTSLRSKHPNIRFSVLSRTVEEITHLIEHLEVDAGLTYIDDMNGARVMTVPLYQEEYRFITAATAPLGHRKQTTWAEVAEHPLCLLTPDTRSRQIIDGMLRRSGSDPVPTLESNSMMVLMDHIRTGQWASVLSAKVAQTIGLHEPVRAIPIVEPNITHTIGIVVPEREPMTPLNAALVAETRRIHQKSNALLPAFA